MYINAIERLSFIVYFSFPVVVRISLGDGMLVLNFQGPSGWPLKVVIEEDDFDITKNRCHSNVG